MAFGEWLCEECGAVMANGEAQKCICGMKLCDACYFDHESEELDDDLDDLDDLDDELDGTGQ